MRPSYRQYDLFLTANSSAAPRLDRHDVARSFWKGPNLTSPFNCTGGPALAVLCGFTRDGLPLSMQIAGRPFDDARVLRYAGHAFERATGLHKRRPMLIASQKAAAIDPKPWVPDTAAVEPAVRALAENAGYTLRPPSCLRRSWKELVAVAPWALAMARRLSATTRAKAETASIFDPGRDID